MVSETGPKTQTICGLVWFGFAVLRFLAHSKHRCVDKRERVGKGSIADWHVAFILSVVFVFLIVLPICLLGTYLTEFPLGELKLFHKLIVSSFF
jgi:uncharacterized YccA/Bax inhibitor family protein